MVGKKNDKREGELKILQSTGYLTGAFGGLSKNRNLAWPSTWTHSKPPINGSSYGYPTASI